MGRYYAEDAAGGELQEYETEAGAMAFARKALREYRRNAREDGEWSLDVTDVVVGREDPDAADEDARYVPTHRATAEGSDAAGYDYAMRPVGGAAPVPAPAA